MNFQIFLELFVHADDMYSRMIYKMHFNLNKLNSIDRVYKI